MTAIINATLVMRDHLIPNGVLLMEDGKIVSFGESRKMEIDHAGQVELSIKPTVSNHSTPYYLYGTDED